MGERELIFSIILINIILLIFFVGFVLFIYQYRKRKIIYGKEILKVTIEHQQELLNTQLSAQKETMLCIGNEIHDSVGQKLTLASIYLQTKSHKTNFSLSKEDTEHINNIINEALVELRLISKTLVNPELSQLSLEELLKIDLKRIKDLNLIDTELIVNGHFSLTEFQKNHLYRIFQEFVQNSIKHSKCKSIYTNVSYNEKGLTIEIHDDGCGTEKLNIERGMGIVNMKRRADELGGNLVLTSKLNIGTSLILTLESKIN